MKNLALVKLCILFTLVSCVDDPKDIPPGIQTNPVFFTELTVGQETLQLTAGTEGYTMKTEHFVDDEGITHYIATLSSEICPQTCPSLEIEFFDNQVISHPESGADFTFLQGLKDFYSADRDGTLDIRFFLVQDGSGTSISYWTTSGDTMPLTSNEIHLTAQPDEFIDLCFHREGTGQCSGFAQYCFTTLASSPFIGLLKAEKELSDHILVEMDLQGEAPFEYAWMNGATTPFILIPATEGEEIDVEVVVTDATESSIEITQSIRIENGAAVMCGGTPQFVYSIGAAPFTQFSTVIVRYTDNNGMVYSTEYGPQSAGLFELLNVTDFIASPEGYETKQLELAIAGTLYSADGSQQIELSTGNTVVAVSYER